MKEKNKLYTVPFSEVVPTSDKKHGYIGLLISAPTKHRATMGAKNRLEFWDKEERHEKYNDPLYNPPIVTKVLDKANRLARELKGEAITKLIENIVNESQVHITTPSEILHSNFASGEVDHTGYDREYVRFHLFHWDEPEEWFDPDRHTRMMKEAREKDKIGIFGENRYGEKSKENGQEN